MIKSLAKYTSYINNLINKGHSRSVRTKKNIILAVIVKGLSILVSLLMVPLTLDYLDSTKYGIWLTLSSFIGWFTFFDIGLGHGLRNRFAEAVARGKYKLARIYVSTTYAVLGIIMAGVCILFALVNPFINWSQVFNSQQVLNNELGPLVLLVFSFFCLQFVLDLVGIILSADQRPAINDLFRLISSILSLSIIYVLTKVTEGSLWFFGLAVSGTSIIVYLIVSLVLYSTRYKQYAPNFKFIRFKYAKDLLNLGVQFFLIQIVWIVIFATDNVIIAQLFGPEEVGPYNIAFKYFGMITMVFNILTAPLWSAYTEAYVKEDYDWINGTIRKLKKAWMVMVLGSIVLLAISPFFYKLWIGNKLTIPFFMSFCMFIYVVAVTWGSIFVIFLNGIGKVRLQLYFAIGAGILNIPLCILFAKTFQLGPSGVILATTVCMSFGPVLAPIQFKKILNKTAKGIWNK
ncbi:MAG TPA: lipopolysaccharide biosynthesis protein [Chitinophagaceae bacterium]|nr:lipopolysaccharide biosynthesis protein [Chitinophagaceae bacterium]